MEVEFEHFQIKLDKEEDLLHQSNKRIRVEVDVPSHPGKE